MPFPLHLFNPQNFPKLTARRVTLVRFVRSTDDVTIPNASDPDDRGFIPDATFANAHGPAFGISGPDGAAVAQACNIRVMRDRLEPAAQLFAEIADPTLVTLVSPAAGSPLDPVTQFDTIIVRAARAPAADTSTTLRLHFGSITGPVVGECIIRVLPVITIPVKGHLVTINGVAPSSNAQTFIDLVSKANDILTAAGIKLSLDPVIQPDSIVGLTTANTVTLLDNTAHFDSELSKVMRIKPVAGVLNVHIVGNLDQVTGTGAKNHNVVAGVGISSVRAASRKPSGSYVGGQTGFVARDPDDLDLFAWVFAHELGHVLTLEHYNNKQVPNVQHNNWSQRNIMYNHVNVFSEAPVNNVGYGFHPDTVPDIGGQPRPGTFIGIKQLTRIFQGNQSDIMRTAANNGTFLIV